MTKDDLRLEMKRRREALDPAEAARASLEAQARLGALPAFRRARCIGLYLARAGEVATGRLVEAAFAAGRDVAVPARCGGKSDYRFCRLRPGAPLRVGALGIGEPARPEWLEAAELDVVVTPGVAFDARGHRLGHGLGCYDRMLAEAGRAFKAGLCFEWQMAPEVPAEERDVAMDVVVTEWKIYGGEAEAGAQPGPASNG